jgi:hypothetical protein
MPFKYLHQSKAKMEEHNFAPNFKQNDEYIWIQGSGIT